MMLPGAAPLESASEPRFWPRVDPDEVLDRGPFAATPITGEDPWDSPTRGTLYGVDWRPPANPHDAKQMVARLCDLPPRGDDDTDTTCPTVLGAVPTPPHGFLLERVLGPQSSRR